MAGKTIVICRLPCGLEIEVGEEVIRHASGHSINVKSGKRLRLNGIRDSELKGAAALYGKTYVDSDFWNAWIAAHPDFPAIACGAIFTVEKESEILPTLKAFEDRRTGLEPMRKDSMGVKTAEA